MSQYDKINRLQAINKSAQLALNTALVALRNAKGDLEQADRVKADLDMVQREFDYLREHQTEFMMLIGKLIEHTAPEFLEDDKIQFDADEKQALRLIHNGYLQSLT